MPRRKRRGRRNRQNRPRQRFYVESFTFSLKVGQSAILTMKQLVGLPKQTPWLVKWVEVKYSPGYALPTTDRPGFYIPVSLQLVLGEKWDPTLAMAEFTSSLPTLATSEPKTIRLNYPNGDFYPPSVYTEFQWGRMDAICLGADFSGLNAYVRGVVRVGVALRDEILASTCPTYDF